MRTKETKGEVIFTGVCLVILLAFIAYFARYLLMYGPWFNGAAPTKVVRTVFAPASW